MRREILLRIIDLCKTVREKALDPFKVDVVGLFERLKELLPELRDREELYEDLEAVLSLSDVVLKQEEWVKVRSSLLYFDPLLTLLKIETLPPEDLAEVLVRAWHPIVDIQQLMPGRLKEAIEYWWSLPPLEERWREEEAVEAEPGLLERDRLASLGFLSEEEFRSALQRHREELEALYKDGKPASYWDFIDGETFSETVERAYMTSLLCSYGYAEIHVDPLEERITIKPVEGEKPSPKGEARSLPIPIRYRDWLRRREEWRRRTQQA